MHECLSRPLWQPPWQGRWWARGEQKRRFSLLSSSPPSPPCLAPLEISPHASPSSQPSPPAPQVLLLLFPTQRLHSAAAGVSGGSSSRLAPRSAAAAAQAARAAAAGQRAYSAASHQILAPIPIRRIAPERACTPSRQPQRATVNWPAGARFTSWAGNKWERNLKWRRLLLLRVCQGSSTRKNLFQSFTCLSVCLRQRPPFTLARRLC